MCTGLPQASLGTPSQHLNANDEAIEVVRRLTRLKKRTDSQISLLPQLNSLQLLAYVWKIHRSDVV